MDAPAPVLSPRESLVATAAAAPERRGVDRRLRPTPMWSRYALFGGRRRGGRRADETENTFVDQHGPGLFLVALSVIALNLLDAWFTLLFLSHGGRELNPFVQEVLDIGPMVFVTFKTIGIGAGVAFLVVTKNFRASRIGITTVLVGYTLLLGWHLLLLSWLDL